MPSVMIRQTATGQLTLYVAKKDLEAPVVSIEHERPDCWGGRLLLADGTTYYIDPLPTAPGLPITVRARRGGGDGDVQ